MPTGEPTSRPSHATVFAVAWLVFFTVLQWSVVRYRVPIVATLTVATVALALWQWRGWRVELTRPAVVLMLAGSALATLLVPLFSYLAPTGLAVATSALIVGPLAVGALLWSHGSATLRSARAAGAVAVLAYVVAAATAVVSSPRPRIDVWVTLQQASDALARGENFYAMRWTGSPGIQDAFTYLPWTAVLLAPGRWLAGDVRWALAAWTLLAVVGVLLLALHAPAAGGARRSVPASHATGGLPSVADPAGTDPLPPVWTGAAVGALLLLAPGTLTQLDQAWTEPLLFAGLVGWAVLVQRGHAWWAVVPLALACASKQHLALLLPVLLVWRPFGWRRTVATGALTGALLAPWFLASPPDFVHDTITLLLSFHPIKFANTLYLTGVAVLGTLAAVVLTVLRRQPHLGDLLRWLALVLLVANLVNKQAFYNQFWLVGALVVLSLAASPRLAPASRDTATQAPPRTTTSSAAVQGIRNPPAGAGRRASRG
jgi:hypothetical protein